MEATILSANSKAGKKIDLDVVAITIPAKDHIKDLPKDALKPSGNWFGDWWLSSPGDDYARAKFVDKNGNIEDHGHLVLGHYGVRPALQIDNIEACDLRVGDKIEAAGSLWTVISSTMILCDEVIGSSPFNYYLDDGNNYKSSDLCHYVEFWASLNGVGI